MLIKEWGVMGQTKIGINGFGRIGRNAFKIAFERSDIEIVAINDIADIKALAYLLEHDSNYGTYHYEIKISDDGIIVNGKNIKVLRQGEPLNIPWGELGVEVVIESTGYFTSQSDAQRHLTAGAKRVVISGPNADESVNTIVLGVNEDNSDKDNLIISCASPTTNAIGALLAILDGEFSVQKSLLTTIHSYTSNQSLVDKPSDNLREGRSAAENIVPSTTGAVASIQKVLPQLAGKFDGLSLRIPTAVVSLADVTVLLGHPATVDEINALISKSADLPFYQGILGVSNEQLVSRDFIGNSFSGIVDLPLTKVVGGNLAKIMIWYDNEWGYSNRLVEIVADTGRSLHI